MKTRFALTLMALLPILVACKAQDGTADAVAPASGTAATPAAAPASGNDAGAASAATPDQPSESVSRPSAKDVRNPFAVARRGAMASPAAVSAVVSQRLICPIV